MAGVLEAFVKLFADDTELRKSFGVLPGDAAKAGDAAAASFTAAFNRGVTHSRAGGAQPLQLQRVGGREVDATGSPFSTGFQQFKQARELAQIQQGGGALNELGKISKAAGETTESFHGARTAARLFGTTIASEVSPGFGEFVAASVHGTQSMGAFGGALGGVLAITALYVQRLKEATDFQVKLNTAAASGDIGAAEALFKEQSANLEKLEQLKKEAAEGAGSFGGAPPFRAFFANLQLAFGAGVDELRGRARAAAALIGKDFAETTGPRNQLEAQSARLQLLTQGLGIERQAAESADALRASTQKLAQARKDSGEVEAKKIELERIPIIKGLADALAKVGDDSKAAADLETVAKGKLADIDRRALDARKKAALDVRQIQRDGIRDADAAAAAEIDATEKIRATVAQRRDAILAAAKVELEARAETDLSVADAFAARRQLEEASTRSTLANLREETDARKASARERLADQPVALERELTQITQEETTKRTQILAQAVQTAIQLAQRERQERIAQATQLFGIQQTLGRQILSDELARQTAIAQAAATGSKVQLDALTRVAALVKQTSDQAKTFLAQALAASDQLAQKAGVEGPAFVSRASLAKDAATRLRQLQQAQDQLDLGKSVAREDAQALAAGQLDQLREQQRAGIAALARRSVNEGQSFDQFRRGALSGTGSFEEQISTAFKTPAELFKTQVGDQIAAQLDELTAKASTSFTGLVTGATAEFGNLEAAWAGTVDRMVAKAQDGTSLMGQSILKLVEADLARSLRDIERRS